MNRICWAVGSLLIVTVLGCGPSGPAGATLSYWNRLIECSRLKTGRAGDARTQAAADYRLRADAIERLPAVGVDPDATRIGLGGARLLREQATLIEQGGSLQTAAFMDGFVWGLTGEGDPFATTNQYDSGVHSWGGRYQAWCDETQRVRVLLTNRYGTEFPNLIRATPASSQVTPTQPATGPWWWSRQSWKWRLMMIGFVLYLLFQFLVKQAKGSKHAQ